MRLLITGGTGFVGGWIAERALAAGHQVRVIARDPVAGANSLDSRVEVIGGSLTDPGAMGRALEEVHVIVHAAAAYQYGRHVDERMVRETPELARAVFGAAVAAGTRHLIEISSAVVFRPHPTGSKEGVTDVDSPLWDASDVRWGDPYLASKVLAYQETERLRQGGVPVTSIHPTLIIGPRDRGPGVSGTLLLSFIRQRAIPDAALAWTDVRDVADVVVAAAGQQPGAKRIVTIGARPFREVAQVVDEVTGTSHPHTFVPPGVVRVLARINDALGGRLAPTVGPRPSLEFMLGFLGEVNGATGAAALGRPYRSFETSVRDSFAWWAENGVVSRTDAGAAASATSAGR